VHEILHACVDDDFGFSHRRLTAVAAGLHHMRQVINGVVDVDNALTSGLDIAAARSTMNIGACAV
jgi:hypothetical protein